MTDVWTAQGDLFTTDGDPVGAAPVSDEVAALARRLPPSIRLGTSSWSFPGWAGVVWERAATPSVLSRHGLTSYAKHPLLRTVCVDRSWYGPVELSTWRRWGSQVPDDFRFVVKADRVLTWPEEGGEHFLDPVAARELLGPPLEGLGDALGCVIFQFPPLDVSGVGGPHAFAEHLHRFLDALADLAPVRSVEIRNEALLTDDYLGALHGTGAVHVHTVHPSAAPLSTQLAAADPLATPPAFVVRWMLKPTLTYRTAKNLYDPFDRLQAPDPGTRTLLANALNAAVARGIPSWVIANNKAEGSSPLSLLELAKEVAG